MEALTPQLTKIVEEGTRGEIIDALLALATQLEKARQELAEEQRFVRLVREMFPDFYVVFSQSRRAQ